MGSMNNAGASGNSSAGALGANGGVSIQNNAGGGSGANGGASTHGNAAGGIGANGGASTQNNAEVGNSASGSASGPMLTNNANKLGASILALIVVVAAVVGL